MGVLDKFVYKPYLISELQKKVYVYGVIGSTGKRTVYLPHPIGGFISVTVDENYFVFGITEDGVEEPFFSHGKEIDVHIMREILDTVCYMEKDFNI